MGRVHGSIWVPGVVSGPGSRSTGPPHMQATRLFSFEGEIISSLEGSGTTFCTTCRRHMHELPERPLQAWTSSLGQGLGGEHLNAPIT